MNSGYRIARRPIILAGLAVILLAAPSRAFAEEAGVASEPEPGPPASDAYLPPSGWQPGFELTLPVATGDDDPLLLGIGVLGSVRCNYLRLGGTLGVLSAVVGSHRLQAGALAGVTIPGAHATIELLAEGGLHHYFGVGSGMFVHNVSGETRANLPYLGARVSLGRRIESVSWLSWLSWLGSGGVVRAFFAFQVDLATRTLRQDVTAGIMGSSTREVLQPVGGGTAMFGLSVGFAP